VPGHPRNPRPREVTWGIWGDGEWDYLLLAPSPPPAPLVPLTVRPPSSALLLSLASSGRG